MIWPLECHLSLPLNAFLCVPVSVGDGRGYFLVTFQLHSCIVQVDTSLYPLNGLVCVLSSNA